MSRRCWDEDRRPRPRDELVLSGARRGGARALSGRGGGRSRRLDVARIPGAERPGVSFGVLAAEALESRQIDGFWANALGSETAVRRGVGRIIVDVRRGDGPPGAGRFTFAALVTTEALIDRDPEA